MNEAEALSRMVPPGQRRPGKPMGGVIQILVTSHCDKACVSCTQASQTRREPWFMTPAQFEEACVSLKGFWGVKGLFGGNPALSPFLFDYCEILKKHFPREECGVWCNNPLTVAKAAAMRGAFSPAISNLNVHLDRRAYDLFKQGWPESNPFGLTQESRHSPPYVSMKDVGIPEEERWELISRCPINVHWSSLLGIWRGKLRAWFCEIAAAAAILHQDEPSSPDTGLNPALDYDRHGRPITNSAGESMRVEGAMKWWQLPMTAFADQVRRHCHDCSVPLQGHGSLSQDPDAPEQVSEAHAAVFRPKRVGRRVELVTTREQLGAPLERMTNYLQKG